MRISKHLATFSTTRTTFLCFSVRRSEFTMTVYHPEYTDSLALDYTIGTCLILIFLVSTTLNPLSFLYHIQRDSKLSSRLYALLAVFDFIVNIYSPLFQAYNFFKKSEDVDREANFQIRVFQGFTNFSGWMSQILINVITCTRLFTINFSFRRVRQIYVWIGLSCTALHFLVMESFQISHSIYWYARLQTAHVSQEKVYKSTDLAFSMLVVVPVAVIYTFGGISSVYTAILLTQDTGPQETQIQRRKSARIILTLSIVNWSILAGIVYLFFGWPSKNSGNDKFVAAYVVVNGLHKITSALNPTIILLLSDEFRSYTKKYLVRLFQKFSSLISCQ